jgi:hypothetical protein
LDEGVKENRLVIAIQIHWFEDEKILACDAKCRKAWGNNRRPKVQLSDDVDDYVFLSDDELGEAPVNPGTAEGWDMKPVNPGARLNRWCCRECERSIMVDPIADFKLPDFGKRQYNMRDADGTSLVDGLPPLAAP